VQVWIWFCEDGEDVDCAGVEVNHEVVRMLIVEVQMKIVQVLGMWIVQVRMCAEMEAQDCEDHVYSLHPSLHQVAVPVVSNP